MEIGYNVSDVKKAMDEIEYNLLLVLEININNGIFVENGMPVHIDGKSINYPKIPFEFPDKYSINYEPFSNRKIAYYLVNRYAIIRMKEDSNFRISAFFISKYLNNPNMLYATCRTNKGDITSHAFTNETVCWIDLINIMENNSISDYNTLTLIDNQVNIDRLTQQALKGDKKK